MLRISLIALALAPLAPLHAATTIVASPSGASSGAGTAASPVDIATAQLRARTVAGKEPVTVELLAGTYRLANPLVFSASDSGTKDAPVTWTAAPGAAVTLSAGVELKPEWKTYKDNILVTDVPADVKPFDQLFANGRAMILARFPNFDAKAAYYNGSSSEATSKERIARWAHPEGGFVHAMHAGMWGDFHYVITGKKPDGTLALEGGTQNNRPEAGPHKSIRFVENIFEELDAPGEWFFDVKARKLYFMPPAGLDVAKTVFSVPQGEQIVRFAGTQDAPVRFVTLRDVTLRETLRTFMKVVEPLFRSDWCVYRGGAVYFNNAEDCAVTGSDFLSLGGNAVFIDGRNRRDGVSGCLFSDEGASAVCVIGAADSVRSPVFNYSHRYDPAKADRTPGPKSDNYPQDCYVTDSLIRRTGRIEKQTAGVTIDVSARTTVAHCTIADLPRAGINIGEGAFGGHLLEGNDVFDTVKETGDHGSFNSWGRDRYWNPSTGGTSAFILKNPEFKFLDVVATNVIRGNRFRYDKSHGWDVDLDDGSSNYLIENNLLLNGGLKFREGYGRVARNNVMVDNSFHPHVWYENSGDIFERNIVFRGYAPIGMPKSKWGERIDNNFLHVGGGKTGPALALQKGSRQDEHSLTGDALFVDPANGDYNVKPGSPALKVGFVNFPMNDYGVRSPRLKAIAPKCPLSKEELTESHNRPEETATLLGATVKNLTGIGEISATGMHDETGVFVVSLDSAGGLAKFGVQERDVILGWNGKPVATLAALQAAVKAAPAPATIDIWRTQAPAKLTPGK